MSKIVWLKYDSTTNGVKEVAVLNGRVRYNIISEFIGAKTMGTVVTSD